MAEALMHFDVTFPVDLIEDLKRIVPPEKLNDLIVVATADYVRKLKALIVLKETAGAWSDEDHPELATPADIDRWLGETRSEWRREPIWAEENHA